MIFKKILKVDFNIWHFHKSFGGTADFASISESHFSDNVPLLIEPPESVQCTEFSAVKMAKSQTNNDYDINSAWAKTPHTDQGATPQDSLGSAVKNGLLNILTQVWDMIWKSYYRADTNPNFDRFDSCRSAMATVGSGLTVATNFYSNWLYLAPNAEVSVGNTIISEHDWYVRDWTIDNGETVFIIDFHTGQTEYMSREVFNTEVSKLGCGAYIAYSQAKANAVETTFVQSLINFLAPFGNVFGGILLALQRIIVQLSL